MITGLQLINEIEDRLGWSQSKSLEGSVTKPTRKITRLVNRVLKNMVAIEQWPMLRAEGTLLTEAALDYQNVRLDLTNGSATVTISAFDLSVDANDDGVGDTQLAPFLLKHKVWAFQLSGADSPVYRIAKINSPTEVELNRVWIGESNTPTGADEDTLYSFTMAMDQYALPEDFDRPTGEWEDFLSAYKVKPVGSEKFMEIRREQGRTIREGDPEYYTVYGLDPTGAYQMLHLNPWPDKQTMMQYNYQRVHPDVTLDVDRVFFPQSQVGIIMEATIYLANRDYKDDTRMQVALQEYLQQFKMAKGQNTVVTDHKQITPDRSSRARSIRVRKRSGIRYDYGDTFDIVGMVDLPK